VATQLPSLDAMPRPQQLSRGISATSLSLKLDHQLIHRSTTAPADLTSPILSRIENRTRSNASAEFLGEPNEKPFGATDVAEPIRVFVLDHFADELSA
jgi:hypothetical protein